MLCGARTVLERDIVDLEHRADCLLVAEAQDVVGGLTSRLAEILRRRIEQVEREQSLHDRIAVTLSEAAGCQQFAPAGRPMNAWVYTCLDRIQADWLAIGEMLEGAAHLEERRNLKLAQQRGGVPGEIAPLGHQSGNPRKDLYDFRRGLTDEHHGAIRRL